jgi:hypothetical protein
VYSKLDVCDLFVANGAALAVLIKLYRTAIALNQVMERSAAKAAAAASAAVVAAKAKAKPLPSAVASDDSDSQSEASGEDSESDSESEQAAAASAAAALKAETDAVHALVASAAAVPFPVQSVLSRAWHNRHAQLSLIKQLIAAPASIVSFAAAAGARALKPADAGFDAATEAQAAAEHLHQHHAWYSLELIETLLNLSESGVSTAAPAPTLYAPVRAMFHAAAQRCKHLVVCGLVQVRCE